MVKVFDKTNIQPVGGSGIVFLDIAQGLWAIISPMSLTLSGGMD